MSLRSVPAINLFSSCRVVNLPPMNADTCPRFRSSILARLVRNRCIVAPRRGFRASVGFDDAMPRGRATLPTIQSRFDRAHFLTEYQSARKLLHLFSTVLYSQASKSVLSFVSSDKPANRLSDQSSILRRLLDSVRCSTLNFSSTFHAIHRRRDKLFFLSSCESN